MLAKMVINHAFGWPGQGGEQRAERRSGCHLCTQITIIVCLLSQIYSVLAGTKLNSSMNYVLVVKNLSRLIQSRLYLKKLATFRNLKHKAVQFCVSVIAHLTKVTRESYSRSCALENCLSNIKLNDIVYKTMGINNFKA